MFTWSRNLHAFSDKASQRYTSQVGNSQKQRKSSSSTPKSIAKPLPETEVIERLTNNLPSQAKVDSKAKTAALLGVSRSRERERTPKNTTSSAASRSTCRASSLSMHSAAMDDQENTVDDTVLDKKDAKSVFTGNNTAPPGSAPLTSNSRK